MTLSIQGTPYSTWSVAQLQDLVQQIISGAGTITVAITGGTVNGAVVGGVTPAAGTFTTLSATNAVALSPASHNVVLSPTGTGVVTIAPATAGSMDRVNIGANTAGTAAFTTLAASSTTALSGATTVSGATVLSNASVKATALPTADPHVVGQLWANSGVVTVSAGA